MSKSAQLRLSDVRHILRIVGECRDLGDDPLAWRKHWCGEVARLTGAGLIMAGELALTPKGGLLALGEAEWGWENGFNRKAWLEGMEDHRENLTVSPMLEAYLARARVGLCDSRTDLIGDREWYRSRYFKVFSAPLGVDHSLFCMSAPSQEAGTFS